MGGLPGFYPVPRYDPAVARVSGVYYPVPQNGGYRMRNAEEPHQC